MSSDGATYEKFADGTTTDISGVIPFDLPKGWVWARLGSTIQLLSGRDLAPQEYSATAKGIAYITGASNLQEGKVVLNRWTEQPQVVALKNDLLFTCKGAGVGKYAFLQIDCAHIARQIMAIRPFAILDREFLGYFMEYSVEMVRAKMNGLIPGISRDDVLGLLLPLPPISEQKRIVETIENLLPRLDEYDKAQTAATTYEAVFPDAFRKSVLQAAVQGKLVPQIPTDEPAEEMLARLHKIEGSSSTQTKRGKGKTTSSRIFRDSDKRTYETRSGETVCIDDELPFEIPSNWTWARLSSLGRFHGGHTPSMADPSLWGGDILWVSSKDMKGNEIVDTEDKITDKGAQSLEMVMPGSLVMVTRSGILKHTFPVAIVRTPCTINQDLRAFVPRFPELVPFLFWTLKGMQKWILEDFRKAGTTVQSITWDRFVEMPVPIPPLAEQKRIVVRVEELLEAGTRLQATPS